MIVVHTEFAELHQGDSLVVLDELPAGSIHCCVTSPPYWNQRDYQVEGQLGMEPAPDCLGWATGRPCGECYVCHMVLLFRKIHRVLRDDGTLWLNLGDSYASGGRGCGLKDGNLVGIPWRVAFALQADGWVLRQEIIWAKPNPMPESVKNRCTKAHEQFFLLVKGPGYYFDNEAIKERPSDPGRVQTTYARPNRGAKAVGPHARGAEGLNHQYENPKRQWTDGSSRNKRSVWSVSIKPFKGAHFAVFSPELITPCILAGASRKGACPTCAAPWRRLVVEDRVATRPGTDSKTTGATRAEMGNRDPRRHVTATRTVGWRPGCSCYGVPIIGDPPDKPVQKADEGDNEYADRLDRDWWSRVLVWERQWEGLQPTYAGLTTDRPRVLDPFSGSGTTVAVAVHQGCVGVGVELNPEYIAMAADRAAAVEGRRGFGF